MPEQKQQTFLEKCVKDKQGTLTLFQVPNLPLLVWLVSVILAKFIKAGNLHIFFDLLAFGALFTWAWLEIFSGVNYVRRVFGTFVIIGLLYSRM